MFDTLPVIGQRERILTAESALEVGPVALARMLATPYTTLRDWKAEKVRMPGSAWVAIELLTKNKK
jgi:hypothetical protein